VTDPQAARALTSQALRAALTPFLGRELTLTQAASEASLSVKRLHALSITLRRLGLLRVTRETKRAGRAVKSYTAVASALFLPFHVTTFETFERALDRADAPFRAAYFASLAHLALDADATWGLRVTRVGLTLQVEAGAAPGSDFGFGAPDAPAVMPLTWSDDLRLNFEDAKALQRDLEALRAKYAQKGGAGRYLLRLAFAPTGPSGR